MKYVEDRMKRYMRVGIYIVLASVSGTIGFLGFRDHQNLTTSGDSLAGTNLFETVHADGDSDTGDRVSDSASNDDGNDGTGGNGSDNGSDNDDNSGDSGS